MLSYRHSFRGQPRRRPFTRTVQSLIIESLKREEKPFLYLDAPPARAAISWSGEHAEHAGVNAEGISRIWQQTTCRPRWKPTFPSSSISTVAASCATRFSPLIARQRCAEQGSLITRTAPERFPAAAFEFQKMPVPAWKKPMATCS